MAIESSKIDKILNIAHELLQIQDIDVLLESVLTRARQTIGADAGSIYLVDGDALKFRYTQNNTLQKKLAFGKKLIYSTSNIPINNQSIAGYVANTGILVNLEDAYSIDGRQPYSFDKHFDEATGYRTQTMLSVPIKNPLGNVVGVIQLINAISRDGSIRSFTAIDEGIVQLFADNAAVALYHAKAMRSVISRMNRMIELHDPTETVEHANRVAATAVEIYEVWARKKGVPEKEIQHNRDVLRMAAMFHDIGKISVPDSILRKSEGLTQEELKIKRWHTIYGARLFADASSEVEKMAQSIALNHHERWDGTGYPGHVDINTGLPLSGYEKSDGEAYGKSGLEVPIYGRITAVANAYDTLTYKFSVYGNNIEPTIAIKKQALEVISQSSGTQFDPEVVSVFMGCFDSIDAACKRYWDSKKQAE